MKAYLEPDEITLLENAANNLRDKLLIHLIFRLGSRITEVLCICVDDIDSTQHTVKIIHLKRRKKILCFICGVRLGTHHIFCPKCGKRVEKSQTEEQENRFQRVLPLDSETLEFLKEYMEKVGPVTKEGRQFIFGINRHRAWQIIKKCAEKAGLPKLVNPETGKVHNVSPHKLRDAFAVHAMKMDDSGEGMRLLQEHLGHASFNTTARYRKIASEEHRIWYEKLWQNTGGK